MENLNYYKTRKFLLKEGFKIRGFSGSDAVKKYLKFKRPIIFSKDTNSKHSPEFDNSWGILLKRNLEYILLHCYCELECCGNSCLEGNFSIEEYENKIKQIINSSTINK